MGRRASKPGRLRNSRRAWRVSLGVDSMVVSLRTWIGVCGVGPVRRAPGVVWRAGCSFFFLGKSSCVAHWLWRATAFRLQQLAAVAGGDSGAVERHKGSRSAPPPPIRAAAARGPCGYTRQPRGYRGRRAPSLAASRSPLSESHSRCCCGVQCRPRLSRAHGLVAKRAFQTSSAAAARSQSLFAFAAAERCFAESMTIRVSTLGGHKPQATAALNVVTPH
jgi:hypothetical protein